MTERKLRDEPIKVVEGWALDLYCRYTVDVAHDMDTHGVTYGGVDRADARKQAKDRGWKFHRDGTTSCPSCVRALKL